MNENIEKKVRKGEEVARGEEILIVAQTKVEPKGVLIYSY